MAMASPPSVMVLIDRPISSNTMSVISTDIGMAISEMSVVCQLSRNTNSTTATTTSASTSTRFTLPIEVSMNVAWRNWTSVGRHARRASRAAARGSCASIWRVMRDRVGVGLLLDAEDDGRLAVEAGVAALGAGGEIDVGHLAQRDRLCPSR